MRVILVTTIIPFIRGGAEYMADSLWDALREAGHTVDRFDLPFYTDYRSMLQQMTALRLLDIADHGDRLIALRTPSYLIQHPKKVVWFIHHHRPAFDLWGTEFQDLPGNAEGLALREAFRSADNVALREATALFVNSRRMAKRVREYNELEAEVLYPPLRRDHGLFAGAYGDYILCPGRLVRHKRQHLFVQALRYATTPVRIIVAGPGEQAYIDDLYRIAEAAGAGDRVCIIDGWLHEEEKTELYASALAVGYAPHDEDSYGYVTLEAAHCRKPVLTCADSGGLLEFVEHDLCGFVSDPRPEAIAECLDRLWDKRVARRMGRNAFERMAELNISWHHVITRLLSSEPLA